MKYLKSFNESVDTYMYRTLYSSTSEKNKKVLDDLRSVIELYNEENDRNITISFKIGSDEENPHELILLHVKDFDECNELEKWTKHIPELGTFQYSNDNRVYTEFYISTNY